MKAQEGVEVSGQFYALATLPKMQEPLSMG
jgi:hypothetical protein